MGVVFCLSLPLFSFLCFPVGCCFVAPLEEKKTTGDRNERQRRWRGRAGWSFCVFCCLSFFLCSSLLCPSSTVCSLVFFPVLPVLALLKRKWLLWGSGEAGLGLRWQRRLFRVQGRNGRERGMARRGTVFGCSLSFSSVQQNSPRFKLLPLSVSKSFPPPLLSLLRSFFSPPSSLPVSFPLFFLCFFRFFPSLLSVSSSLLSVSFSAFLGSIYRAKGVAFYCSHGEQPTGRPLGATAKVRLPPVFWQVRGRWSVVGQCGRSVGSRRERARQNSNKSSFFLLPAACSGEEERGTVFRSPPPIVGRVFHFGPWSLIYAIWPSIDQQTFNFFNLTPDLTQSTLKNYNSTPEL